MSRDKEDAQRAAEAMGISADELELAEERAKAALAMREMKPIPVGAVMKKHFPDKTTRRPRRWNRAARRAYMSNRYGKRSTDVHGKELEELRSARKRRNKAAKQARRRNRK